MEIWRDVTGYEGFYQVSSYGRVYSFGGEFVKSNGQRNFMRESLINPYKNKQGYMFVKLCKLGECKNYRVHRLVALNFISNSNPKDKTIINHIDGNKTNNNVKNLEWVDYSENSFHAHSIGLCPKPNANKYGNHQGEKHGGAKLTEDKVIFIRKNSKKNGGNYTNAELSILFGVSTSVVSNVINYKAWKHVEDRKDVKE